MRQPVVTKHIIFGVKQTGFSWFQKCVTLCTLPKLSEVGFCHLQSGNNNLSCYVDSVRYLIHVNCIAHHPGCVSVMNTDEIQNYLITIHANVRLEHGTAKWTKRYPKPVKGNQYCHIFLPLPLYIGREILFSPTFCFFPFLTTMVFSNCVYIPCYLSIFSFDYCSSSNIKMKILSLNTTSVETKSWVWVQ